MSLVGKTIKVIGVSQKGKNRIREHGDEWVVLAETDHVLFNPNQPGPWLFISPPGMGQDSKPSRWMHLHNDPTFGLAKVLGLDK